MACLTRREVRICWSRSLSLKSKKRQLSFHDSKRVPFADARTLHEPDEFTSTALTQGRLTTGTAIAPALDSVSPQTAGGQNRRERFRDSLIDQRSTISKCFGTPPVCEANHIAEQSQCSCQNNSLPSRHTHRVSVVERQRFGRNVSESRFGKDLRSLARLFQSLDCGVVELPMDVSPRRRVNSE